MTLNKSNATLIARKLIVSYFLGLIPSKYIKLNDDVGSG